MIKISNFPDKSSSMIITYKNHSIIYNNNLKLFKDNKDISHKVGEYDVSGDGLKKIYDWIDFDEKHTENLKWLEENGKIYP